MAKLSHIDEQNRPTMVDVSDKVATDREAHARTVIELPAVVVDALDGDEIATKKGPVFATAVIASSSPTVTWLPSAGAVIATVTPPEGLRRTKAATAAARTTSKTTPAPRASTHQGVPFRGTAAAAACGGGGTGLGD